ncbi:MAG: HesA/MoeB/ThiF family protein [Bacteroidia bacterium]|nr:HesA/MoeB/ThiF family protein [Bacteroidia bacterium]
MRYSKQTILQEIGEVGQAKLAEAKVAIVGCGGLGSIVAPYLAGAGIGQLTLIDADIPDITNLHRQVVFKEGETSTKSAALAQYIKALNSNVNVIAIEKMISKANISDLLEDHDLVIECTDDMMTKYMVNDYCHWKKIPMVYGAIYKFDGYVSLFENDNDQSIHLRDVFPEPDLDVPSCSEIGVINSISGLIGMLQANEALKYLLGIGENLSGKLLTYNVLNNDQLKLKLKKTWNLDIEAMFNSQSYVEVSCLNVPEISYEDLLSNIENYKVVSILEDNEHVDISISNVRAPMSTINLDDWSNENQATVFYCMSGKRSAKIVEQLLLKNSMLDIYSLKDGFKGIQNSKLKIKN